MNRDNYIGGSISTRIKENNLLTKNDLERLVDYESLDEVLNALNDSSYRDSIGKLKRPEEYELILKDELEKAYEDIKEASDNKEILQYFIERYNFHNLKVLAKEIIQNENYPNLYSDIANIDIDYIKKNLSLEGQEKSFLESLDIEGYKPFNISSNTNDEYLAYVKDAIEEFKQTNNPKDLDLSLDRDYYKKILEDAQKIGIDELIQYTKERIDLINTKILLRIKAQDANPEELDNALIPGGFVDISDFKNFYLLDLGQIIEKLANEKIGKYLVKYIDPSQGINESLLNLEKAIDDHQVDYSKVAKTMTYGPEVLINYIVSKETEIKNLRIIFVSKLNSLTKEFTLERLRETYA